MTSWQTGFSFSGHACGIFYAITVQEVVEGSLLVLMVNAFLEYTTVMALLTAWTPVMNVTAVSLTLLWYCNVKRIHC